jgi:CBS domain-containing protein
LRNRALADRRQYNNKNGGSDGNSRQLDADRACDGGGRDISRGGSQAHEGLQSGKCVGDLPSVPSQKFIEEVQYIKSSLINRLAPNDYDTNFRDRALGQIIGIVMESDIVKKFVGADKTPYFVPVEDIMSSPVPGIEERRPLTEAADLMERHRTLHLSVTKGGALIGLVSVRDFLRPVSIDGRFSYPR